MQCCPICLSPVLLEEEAFLQPCWHRFHSHCIQRWSEMQQSHSTGLANSSNGGLKCPMCRQPYVAIIFDCVDQAFRFAWVDPQRAASQPPPVGYTMQLTPQQRRRRSVYFRNNRQPQQQKQQVHCDSQGAGMPHPDWHAREHAHRMLPSQAPAQTHCQSKRGQVVGASAEPAWEGGASPSSQAARSSEPAAPEAAAGEGGGGGGAGDSKRVVPEGMRKRALAASGEALHVPRKQPRRLDDPLTRQWLERELQALVLEEDVSLLLAAAWGSLLAACRQQQQQQQQQQKLHKAQASPYTGQQQHEPHEAKAAGPLSAITPATQGPWPGLALAAATTRAPPAQTHSTKTARPVLRGPALAMPRRPHAANRAAPAMQQSAPTLPPHSAPAPPEADASTAAGQPSSSHGSRSHSLQGAMLHATGLQSEGLTASQGAMQPCEGGSRSSWQGRLSEAVQPFLEPAHAQQLPLELEAFLSSGLSIQAYDQQTFQPQPQQEQEQEQEQDTPARVSNNKDTGRHEAVTRKRHREGDLSGSCPEVIVVFDEEEGGCHRPGTPISISSSSDSD